MGRERGGHEEPTDANFVVVRRPSLSQQLWLSWEEPAASAGRQEGWPVACQLLLLVDHWPPGPSQGCLLLRTARGLGSGAIKGQERSELDLETLQEPPHPSDTPHFLLFASPTHVEEILL